MIRRLRSLFFYQKKPFANLVDLNKDFKLSTECAAFFEEHLGQLGRTYNTDKIIAHLSRANTADKSDDLTTAHDAFLKNIDEIKELMKKCWNAYNAGKIPDSTPATPATPAATPAVGATGSETPKIPQEFPSVAIDQGREMSKDSHDSGHYYHLPKTMKLYDNGDDGVVVAFDGHQHYSLGDSNTGNAGNAGNAERLTPHKVANFLFRKVVLEEKLRTVRAVIEFFDQATSKGIFSSESKVLDRGDMRFLTEVDASAGIGTLALEQLKHIAEIILTESRIADAGGKSIDDILRKKWEDLFPEPLTAESNVAVIQGKVKEFSAELAASVDISGASDIINSVITPEIGEILESRVSGSAEGSTEGSGTHVGFIWDGRSGVMPQLPCTFLTLYCLDESKAPKTGVNVDELQKLLRIQESSISNVFILGKYPESIARSAYACVFYPVRLDVLLEKTEGAITYNLSKTLIGEYDNK